MASRSAAALAALMLVAAGPAFAQGRGNGQNKAAKSSAAAAQSGIPASSSAVTAANAPSTSASSVIYYGSWLDDASIVPAGGGWISLSTGYWKAEALRQVDAPVVSAIAGLHRRVQVGASVPIYHFSDNTGISETGVGNAAIYGKAQLIDPGANVSGFGLAIAPLMEISSGAQERFGWALPLNVELRREGVRLYGSGGYFSRGSVFGSAAAELMAGSRASITGSFGQSYARAGTHQSSIGISLAVFASPTTSVFVGLGRTFQPVEVGPGGSSIAGGASFMLFPPKTGP